MNIIAILLGLSSFLGAAGLWDRSKNQPDDIPMFSMFGQKEVSKREVRRLAIILLLIGIFWVVTGFII